MAEYASQLSESNVGIQYRDYNLPAARHDPSLPPQTRQPTRNPALGHRPLNTHLSPCSAAKDDRLTKMRSDAD
ncbi:hypothetical protein E2C01_098300 [Portunus trituberculatus]|uniref:Uncharacterized protein n=1 Tax=Portunus trituberculatus TaxID=210409 RepID=A0A5B7K2N6_PORTR|nr:hypothetical protein [Portunus trituberculatus]